MDAAELLHAAREGAGLSQAVLARRSWVSQSTVSRIEAGIIDPSWSTMQRLLDTIGWHVVLRETPPEPGLATLGFEIEQYGADDPAFSIRLIARTIQQWRALPEVELRVRIFRAPAMHDERWRLLLEGALRTAFPEIEPPWVTGGRLPERWAPIDPGRYIERVWAATPPELRARNVALRAGSLEAV